MNIFKLITLKIYFNFSEKDFEEKEN